MDVVASLSQGRIAAAQCGLFTYKSVPVIFKPPCILYYTILYIFIYIHIYESARSSFPPQHNSSTMNLHPIFMQ